jgi:hypothetical protein
MWGHQNPLIEEEQAMPLKKGSSESVNRRRTGNVTVKKESSEQYNG